MQNNLQYRAWAPLINIMTSLYYFTEWHLDLVKTQTHYSPKHDTPSFTCKQNEYNELNDKDKS